ncbi:MAG TPA: hypothetical protein VF331_17685 [Polyangiales bacterium]
MATPDTGTTQVDEDRPTRLGKFIQTYHSFLSSFVIGAAGLVATSMWQYKQAETASHQAESQQQIASAQAENSWRIERAEILSKNLSVLSSSGQPTVEQRYGVLLSLTRGNILDPELAVSYALELGKDNAEYMKSVLASTNDKSYARLASAFELTCQQRFGVTRDLPLCAADKLSERSTALAQLVAEELESSHAHVAKGPLSLLGDERTVQASPAKLSWLFAPYLTGLYERRLLHEIERFEASSVGAHVISALVLVPAQPDELVAVGEAQELAHFRSERSSWLASYLLGPSCNGECKSKLVDVMLSSYAQAQGRFDAPLRALLAEPRTHVAGVLARLHARLLTCQLGPLDTVALRDQLLSPMLDAQARAAKPDATQLDDLLGLLALTPAAPSTEDDVTAQRARAALQQALDRARSVAGERFNGSFTQRRANAEAARKSPGGALAKITFCSAAAVLSPDVALGE